MGHVHGSLMGQFTNGQVGHGSQNVTRSQLWTEENKVAIQAMQGVSAYHGWQQQTGR